MAHFGKDLDNFVSWSVRITGAEQVETYTVYVIEISVGLYSWTVRHRYSDFHDLHEKLVSSQKIDKGLLPPKKLFGNQSENFIKKRQSELELYLQTVVFNLVQRIPPALSSFLDFHRYEIHGITQALAEDLYNRGEAILQNRESFYLCPLQLYSLTERLKLPEPTCESGDVKKDIGHILDFITRLKVLRVCGSNEHIGTSNIDMNKLKFDLTLFKSLECLELVCCNVKEIRGFETIKQTLHTYEVHRSVSTLREIVLQDAPHWRGDGGLLIVGYWDLVEIADFSHNSITEIDDSIQLLAHVERLDLSHNQIPAIQHLQWLSQLTYLDLSHNRLRQLDALHTKLGNLKTLNLSANNIQQLHGLTKLFSLETLDVSNNDISEMTEIKHISSLPCLENLVMMGNPVTIVLDYRTRALEMFGDRVSEVTLDNQKTSQKELDTVAVLQALSKAKEARVRMLGVRKTSTASLGESEGSLPGSLTSEPCGSSPVPPPSGVLAPPCSMHAREPSPVHPPVESQHLEPTSLPTSLHSISPGKDVANRQPSPLSISSKESKDSQISQSGGESISSSSISDRLSLSLPQRERKRGCSVLDASTLPTRTNAEFMAWLGERLCSGGGGGGGGGQSPRGPVLEVLWCRAVQYSNQGLAFACCAILTSSHVFLQKVTHFCSDFGDVPDMDPFYILPICNIQQVVVGCCHAYVRVEESFVGSMGTFTLLGLDNLSIKAFAMALIATSSQAADKHPPEVLDLSAHSELARQIFAMEDDVGLCSDHIVFASCVTARPRNVRSLLLLSEHRVYLLDIACIDMPPPCFDSATQDTLHLSVFQQQLVMSRISDIKMYEVDGDGGVEEGKGRGREGSIENSPSGVLKRYDVSFTQSGVSMSFHENSKVHLWDVLFSSSAARDTFLDRLTNLRAQHVSQISPTLREEPEGANEPGESSNGAYVATTSLEPQSLPASYSLCYSSSKTEVQEGLTAKLPETRSGSMRTLVGSVDQKELQFPEILTERNDGGEREERKGATVKEAEDGREEVGVELAYLTAELEGHLRRCLQDYHLLQPLPPAMKPFALMNGRDLAQFFHSIALWQTLAEPDQLQMEELHHALWTSVIPYTNPRQELVSLVLLSSSAIYLLSDSVVKSRAGSRPPWMSHNRHQSDSAVAWTSGQEAGEEQGRRRKRMKPYAVLKLSDLQLVNVGLFDQCLRLTGYEESAVFTLATRNSQATEAFVEKLKVVLSLGVSSPMADHSQQEVEQDFYRAFYRRTKSTVDGLEYTHPSQVRFCYPGSETLGDLSYLINQRTQVASTPTGPSNSLFLYLLAFQLPTNAPGLALDRVEGRTLIVTNTHFCLAQEDIVTYPLPDFIRGVPETPQTQILSAFSIDCLKRMVIWRREPRYLGLVFADEPPDLVVDEGLEHFSAASQKRSLLPSVMVRLVIQSASDRDKLMQLLQKKWNEMVTQVGRILDIEKE